MIEIVAAEGEGEATCLRVSGSLDVASRGELERTLERLVEAGENQIRLDLSGVDYLGSVGLAVLINAAKTLRRRGGELRLVTSSAQTRRHLKLLNLESMLEGDRAPSRRPEETL
jgi:anti-sigma B factor antagonist